MRKMIPANQGEFLQKLCVKGNGDVNGLLNIANLVDADGNPRFVEGNINLNSELPEGVEKVYGKWSLSATHLMIVLCMNIANGIEIANNTLISSFTLPKWILDKIYPLTLQIVENKMFRAYSSAFAGQDFEARLVKGSTALSIIKSGAITLSTDKIVRLNFDLLIDSEQSGE